MIDFINKWFTSYLNPSLAEKYNGWSAMIGIISDVGEYAIT